MPETDAVTVRFSLTPKMLLQGHLILKGQRIALTWLVYLLLTSFCLLATWSRSGFSYVLGVWIALWLLLPYAYLLRPWFVFRGMMKEPNMVGECELVADGDSLRGANGQIQTRYEWSSVSQLVERKDLFVLRIGKKHMMVIPKSAFASQDDMARFRKIVTSKIAPAG